jgi:hypothetical protein
VLFINKKSSVYSLRETFTGISSGERDKLLLTLIYRHGLRVSEAVDLRWSDFDGGCQGSRASRSAPKGSRGNKRINRKAGSESPPCVLVHVWSSYFPSSPKRQQGRHPHAALRVACARTAAIGRPVVRAGARPAGPARTAPHPLSEPPAARTGTDRHRPP